MSAELVGPLRRIPFSGERGRAFDLPADTRDLRYTACANHHPACDCREAMIREEQVDLRHELTVIRRAASEALAGHATYDLTAESFMAQALESDRVCPCTGCSIARAVYRSYCQPLRSPSDLWREIQEAQS